MPGRLLPVPVTEPSPVLDPDAARVETTHQLPPHRTQAGRVADHLAAISADLREWTELRIALLWRKVEGVVGIFERIQHLVPALKLFVPAAVLGVFGLMFLLVTLAIGLGALTGQMWLGFLIVTLLLLIPAGVLAVLGLRRKRDAEALVAQARQRQREAAAPTTRPEVQEAQALRARQAAV